MPALSRVMIRLAFVYCWLGFGLAALLISRKGLPELFDSTLWQAYSWQWLPAHVDMLLLGWMVQLSLGTAYWILPRLPNTGSERGRFGFAIGATVLLNSGVIIFTGAVILAAWQPAILWIQTIGLAFQLAAIAAFAIHAWPRIRPAIVAQK
jgi:hypothetical protein